MEADEHMVHAQEIMDLIGRSGLDPRVAGLLEQLGFDQPLVGSDRSDPQLDVDEELGRTFVILDDTVGTDFLFKFAEALPGTSGQPFMEGEPVLISVFFYSKAESALKGLPFGLSFKDDWDRCRAKVAQPPAIIDDQIVCDIWTDHPVYRLSLDYSRDTARLIQIPRPMPGARPLVG